MVKAIFNKIYGKMLKILLHMGKLGADLGTLEGTVWSTPSTLHLDSGTDWDSGVDHLARVAVVVAVAPLVAVVIVQRRRKPTESSSTSPNSCQTPQTQSFYCFLVEIVLSKISLL
jgi:hypothetical protein